jgi:hypothetical protein
MFTFDSLPKLCGILALGPWALGFAGPAFAGTDLVLKCTSSTGNETILKFNLDANPPTKMAKWEGKGWTYGQSGGGDKCEEAPLVKIGNRTIREGNFAICSYSPTSLFYAPGFESERKLIHYSYRIDRTNGRYEYRKYRGIGDYDGFVADQGMCKLGQEPASTEPAVKVPEVKTVF